MKFCITKLNFIISWAIIYKCTILAIIYKWIYKCFIFMQHLCNWALICNTKIEFLYMQHECLSTISRSQMYKSIFAMSSLRKDQAQGFEHTEQAPWSNPTAQVQRYPWNGPSPRVRPYGASTRDSRNSPSTRVRPHGVSTRDSWNGPRPRVVPPHGASRARTRDRQYGLTI